MTFEEYKAKIDARLIRLCGLDSWSLPDYDYWCAWADGVPALECAHDVLAENGYIEEMV